jgi:hypothetical protein
MGHCAVDCRAVDERCLYGQADKGLSHGAGRRRGDGSSRSFLLPRIFKLPSSSLVERVDSAAKGDAAAAMATHNGVNGAWTDQARAKPANGPVLSPVAAKRSKTNGAHPAPNGVGSSSSAPSQMAANELLDELPVVTSEFVNLGDLTERVAARVFADLQNLVEVLVGSLVLVISLFLAGSGFLQAAVQARLGAKERYRQLGPRTAQAAHQTPCGCSLVKTF